MSIQNDRPETMAEPNAYTVSVSRLVMWVFGEGRIDGFEFALVDNSFI